MSWGIWLFVAAAAVVGVLSLAEGASAEEDCNVATQEELLAAPAECQLFLIEPEPGELVSRQDLLSNAELYDRLGYSRNFLWFSQRDKRTFDDGTLPWAYCQRETAPDNACKPDELVHDDKAVEDYFTVDSVKLDVFEVGDHPAYEASNRNHPSFIAGVCGNAPWQDQVPSPIPEPKAEISGVKFRDLNRDGDRDPGEPGIENWKMTLHRQTPAEGVEQQKTTDGDPPVAVAYTDAKGRYTFDANNIRESEDIGPGTYKVIEESKNGWTNTTPETLTQTVEVSFGPNGLNTQVPAFGNARTEADVVKVDSEFTVVDPPARLEKGEPTELTVRARIRNDGPAHLVKVEDVLTASGKLRDADAEDCTTEPEQATRTRQLRKGEAVTLEFTVTVTCARRSLHDFTFDNELSVLTDDIEDPNPDNNTARTVVSIPVFEPADLAVTDMRIACDEYEDPTDFDCIVDSTVTNNGPADAVQTATTVTLEPEPGCSVAPASSQLPAVLDAGETTTLTDTFAVTCQPGSRHTVLAEAVIETAEPHAEDRQPANDTDQILWGPSDTKPRSFPSSVNLNSRGKTPIAVLSTPEFDALTEVDTDSLLYGATGSEDSVIGCKSEGEDVNGDGLPDLICHVDTQATGFTCETDVAVLTGRLNDGTAFESQDAVNIVPCRA